MTNENIKYPSEYDQSHEDEAQPTCTSSIERTNYYMFDKDQLNQVVHSAIQKSLSDTCTSKQLIRSGGEVAQTVDRANTRKRHISDDTDYSEDLEWENTKFFE